MMSLLCDISPAFHIEQVHFTLGVCCIHFVYPVMHPLPLHRRWGPPSFLPVHEGSLKHKGTRTTALQEPRLRSARERERNRKCDHNIRTWHATNNALQTVKNKYTINAAKVGVYEI